MKFDKAVGMCLLSCGILSLVGAGFLFFRGVSDIMEMKAELSNRVVYTKSESQSSVQDMQDSTLIEAPAIEGVNDDMVVDEIVSYQNVLEMPSCNISVPIIEGIDSDSLKRGAGHFTETPEVGEDGNACYAGHYSTVYKCIFNDLPDIKLYDEVWGYNSAGDKFVYYVTGKYVTTPDNISVLAQNKSEKELTIVTCSNSGTMRLIISCKLLSKEDIEAYKEEQQRSRKESMYSINNDIGTFTISKHIQDRNIIVPYYYDLPAVRPHKVDSIKEGLLDELFKD